MPGQLPVDIAGQGGQIADLVDMGFLVQDGLMEVGNAPALRNIELEQFGQFCGGLAGDGVAPGPKRGKEVSGLIEGHIAVHHAAETDRADGLEGGVVVLSHLAAKLAVAGLQAGPHIFKAIGPDAIFILVFPIITA